MKYQPPLVKFIVLQYNNHWLIFVLYIIITVGYFQEVNYMNFCPERLVEVRTSLSINKAEAARRLNISAMAYGRYEKGEREPSYQSVCFIAQTFHCNIDFLYGTSDEMKADYLIVSRSESPELYSLLLEIHENSDMRNRLLTYARKLVENRTDFKS